MDLKLNALGLVVCKTLIPFDIYAENSVNGFFPEAAKTLIEKKYLSAIEGDELTAAHEESQSTLDEANTSAAKMPGSIVPPPIKPADKPVRSTGPLPPAAPPAQSPVVTAGAVQG